MYLVVLHGHGTSACPGASGAPTECTARHEVAAITRSRRSAAAPIRVMIRIETTTYGESVISTPSWEISPPSGPMQNGTTYMVRPRMQPSKISANVSRISSGAIQLLVGPASCSRSEQMNVRSSTRATSPGSEAAPEAVRPLGRIEPVEGPVLDQQARQPVPLGLRAVAPLDLIRLGQVRDLADPLGQLGQPRRCLFVDRACAGHDYHSRRGLTCGGTHNCVRVSYPGYQARTPASG